MINLDARGELADFGAILILIVAAIGLLLADAFAQRREPGFLRGPALLAVGLALLLTLLRLGEPDYDLGHFALSKFLLVDHLTVYCDLLALLVLAGLLGLARDQPSRPGYRADHGPRAFGEREPLLLLAGVGALACIHAGDLLTVWLGAELLGIAALLLMVAGGDAISSPSKREAGGARRRAGLHHGLLIQMIPGAIASCLALLGIALIYAALGSTSLDGLGHAATSIFTLWGGVQRWVLVVEQYAAEIAASDPAALDQAHAEIIRGVAPAALLLPGMLLLLSGLSFKLGLLPFARRRELVEQAPVHVSALWSTLAVVALTAVLLRVFVGALHIPRLVNEPYGWTVALPTVALLTGAWASLAAIRQRRLARMVALLALAQLSLVVLGIVATAGFHGHIGGGTRLVVPEHEIIWARLAGDEAYAAVLIQLAAHVIAALGCFASLAAARPEREGSVRQQHVAGLASRRPGLALALSISLLSLVGLPPLAGFVGKVGILRAIVEHSAMRWLLPVVVLELGIGAWMVLRVIASMYFGDGDPREDHRREGELRSPLWTAYLAAGLSLGLGLGGQRLIVLARLPAAGGSFEPGDKNRLPWLEQRRASWAVEDARFADGPELPELGTDEIEGEGEVLQSVMPSE